MTPEQFARIDKIHGYMSEDELRWLWGQAEKASCILEIGVFKGRATTALCMATKGLVVSVDNWMGSPMFDDDTREMVKSAAVRLETLHAAFTNLQEFRESGKLLLFPINSLKLFDILHYRTLFDFVFIDGGHDELTVHGEIADVLYRAKPGAIIAGHDYNTSFPGVMKAVDRHFPQVNHGANSAGSIWWVQV